LPISQISQISIFNSIFYYSKSKYNICFVHERSSIGICIFGGKSMSFRPSSELK